MTRRTIGIDLAIRGDQVAQIFDDGLPVGKPIRSDSGFEIEILLRHLEATAGLERRIAALYAVIHPSDALRTIPGTGPHLAPVLIGVLCQTTSGTGPVTT